MQSSLVGGRIALLILFCYSLTWFSCSYFHLSGYVVHGLVLCLNASSGRRTSNMLHFLSLGLSFLQSYVLLPVGWLATMFPFFSIKICVIYETIVFNNIFSILHSAIYETISFYSFSQYKVLSSMKQSPSIFFFPQSYVLSHMKRSALFFSQSNVQLPMNRLLSMLFFHP